MLLRYKMPKLSIILKDRIESGRNVLDILDRYISFITIERACDAEWVYHESGLLPVCTVNQYFLMSLAGYEYFKLKHKKITDGFNIMPRRLSPSVFMLCGNMKKTIYVYCPGGDIIKGFKFYKSIRSICTLLLGNDSTNIIIDECKIVGEDTHAIIDVSPGLERLLILLSTTLGIDNDGIPFTNPSDSDYKVNIFNPDGDQCIILEKYTSK